MAKIMIVDDEPAIVKLVKHILEKKGHEVLGAHSGNEALEKIKEEMPDLILLDIMMPHLDGWQTLNLIREMEGFKDTPIAMLTVKALSPETTSREDIGELVDYIQKPITREGLVKTVDRILKALQNISQKKSKVKSLMRDKEAAIIYEISAKRERLHESMLTSLEELLKKTTDPKEADRIRESISSQTKLLTLFKSWRKEAEKRI